MIGSDMIPSCSELWGTAVGLNRGLEKRGSAVITGAPHCQFSFCLCVEGWVGEEVMLILSDNSMVLRSF